jgi:hypothetical protein
MFGQTKNSSSEQNLLDNNWLDDSQLFFLSVFVNNLGSAPRAIQQGIIVAMQQGTIL